jgi:hypothetical protein
MVADGTGPLTRGVTAVYSPPMTSHDRPPVFEAPDVPVDISVRFFRRVGDVASWLDIRVDSGDPWVPSIRMSLYSDQLSTLDHSHKGTAERIIGLLRPALQVACGLLVEDATGEPIDL